MRGQWGGAALLACALAACGPADVAAPPPLEVPVVAVVQRDQPIEFEAVGQTAGSADIPIRARVAGEVQSLEFVEGGTVEKDQLLYTIDDRPFQSAVVEAQGRLAEARTAVAKTRADLDRIRPLAEMRAVSEQDLDSAVAQYEAARGSLQAARAQVEQAEIELGYTRIHAPIAGRIGLSAAKVGEFVGQAPNPVVLNYVSQIHPIRVRFAIDERQYLRLARKLIELADLAEEAIQAGPGLELILADGTVHKHRGRPVARDAAINPGTGTFTVEADFPNPDSLVLAGLFARVRGVIETRPGALLVPQRAIAELQGDFRVFVVGADGTVELRRVVRGPAIGSLQIIESGVAPGEQVALEGLQRLQDKMVVTPRPAEPEPAAAPVGQAADAGA
jgi:membrane fusion protein (multidrug efflux system)